MDSRKRFIWIAIGLAVLLAAFAVLSILTGNAAFVLWAVVPIVMALSTLIAAIRGATKGDRKRDRDARIAAQKAARRESGEEPGRTRSPGPPTE